MSVDYKSGFIEELDRKSKGVKDFIKKLEENKEKLEDSLKNTKYADNAEEEIDKIIKKLKNMFEKNGVIEEAQTKLNNL